MKKMKLPGGNISLKTKKNEAPPVMEWLNAQTNLMDSLRYLIENEIRVNGVRNLQTIIPMDRGPLVAGSAAPAVVVGSPTVEVGQTVGEPAAHYTTLSPTHIADQAPLVALIEQQPPLEESTNATVEDAKKDEMQQVAESPVEEEEIDDEDIESWI